MDNGLVSFCFFVTLVDDLMRCAAWLDWKTTIFMGMFGKGEMDMRCGIDEALRIPHVGFWLSTSDIGIA